LPAILIYHLAFWIDLNRANQRNFHDGHWWSYNSVPAFQKLFPYMTPKQIRSGLEKLVKEGVLLTGHFHENKYDRSLWYAFVDEGRFLEPEKAQMTDLPSGANAFDDSGKPTRQRGQIDQPTRADGSAGSGTCLLRTDVNQGVNQMGGLLPPGWWKSEEQTQEAAKALGLAPIPDEEFPHLLERVRANISRAQQNTFPSV
jgi:hypothetical protein